jgi:hypothetical protein
MAFVTSESYPTSTTKVMLMMGHSTMSFFDVLFYFIKMSFSRIALTFSKKTYNDDENGRNKIYSR